MELYDWMKNLRNIDTEEEIKSAISKTKEQLNSLTEERTCFIYSSYIYEELKNNHVSSRIVSTKDLDYDYEHRFVLVKNEKEEDDYFLIDLTFSQFNNNEKEQIIFNNLIKDGYQKMNNDLWNLYLSHVTNSNKEINYSLSEVYFNTQTTLNKHK